MTIPSKEMRIAQKHSIRTDMRNEEKLKRADHLWTEYQHRHTLVWSLVFRLTTAVVVLAVIPYTQVMVMNRIGVWILAPPIIGVVLGVVGFFRLKRELELFDHIRDLYRPLQDSLFPEFPEFHGDKKSRFKIWILVYIGLLTLLAAFNVPVTYFWWIR
jgi:hypothetical protein